MDDLTRQIENLFTSIKTWVLGLWDEFYAYLINSLGETFTKITLILGAAGIVLFIYFSLQNRN